ncbi:MAG: hypothetical protein HZA90_05655 [Verrucomicrobia bacterium]|nr:hypothetical protein [Verrucomicrobiota bacterium]
MKKNRAIRLPLVQTAAACCLVSCLSASADLVNWTGGAAPNLNWSAFGNWNGGLPGAANDFKFYDDATSSTANTVNNIVDADVTAHSLHYAHSNYLFHTTQIGAGQTLTIANEPGTYTGLSLAAGALITTEASLQVSCAITGAGGTLSILSNHTARLWVGQGSFTNFTTPRATLDLSGLDTFTSSAGQVFVGVKLGTVAGDPLHQNWASGTLILAKTNTIVAAGGSGTLGTGTAILVGYSPSNGGTNYLYLGRTNAIFANGISVGNRKSVGTVAFYEGFTNDNPVAMFRSHTGGRLANFWIGDDFAETGTGLINVGTANFTGGTVDVVADNLIVARGQNINNRDTLAYGELTFDRGTIEANALRIGSQFGYTVTTRGGVPRGTVNVNRSANGPAILKANNTFTMAEVKVAHANANNVTATLNINGGSVIAPSITTTATTNTSGTIFRGNSTIVVNGGLLSVPYGTVGAPGYPITTLQLSDAHLNLSAITGVTNVVASSLVTASTTNNTIDIAGISALTDYPAQFALISYGALAGAYDFTLGSLPPAYEGYLVNNVANATIDLVLLLGPEATQPLITSTVRSGDNCVITGNNGAPNGLFTLLTSTNVAGPLANWTVETNGIFDDSGDFSVTVPISPAAPAKFFMLRLR